MTLREKLIEKMFELGYSLQGEKNLFNKTFLTFVKSGKKDLEITYNSTDDSKD